MIHWRPVLAALLAGAMLAAAMAAAQSAQSAPPPASTPLPLKPDLPGMARNHRLILKDGSYQVVRQYQIAGDRVHYFSQERGDWEDLPVDLVDWDATRKWEQDHNTSADAPSPAMKEAEDIDKEEAAEREDQKARMPQVASGLELPDEEGVFVLDAFQGTPELVELQPKDLNMDSKTRHGLAVLNPLAGQKESLELEGRHARIHLHVNDPAIYLSLGVSDSNEPVLSHPFTVETSHAQDESNGKHGAHSAQSGFAIVQLDQRQAVRIVGAIHVSAAGAVTQDEDVIPATVDLLPGKHWLRIQPQQKLVIGGEYALVEILSPSDISSTVWDFRVDPTEGDNPGSLTPILKQTSER
ncbi:MAG: hypothetical protein WBE72_24250 [Terracidiphilus sp.]